MAKQALYQKYRSATFEEVVGQEYTVRSIRNAIKEKKVGHAYLFCGPRGTGKTTMARLLAKAVNCEHPEKAPCGECDNCIAALNGTHPDIVEINAANETHVEDIRDLIERSTLAPMQGLHKVYIIDEVHQLSSAASSALLKTLEEPPENVIFILATTDPQKLLPTIISRCQRFDFTKVRTDQIRDHLLNIARKENIAMDEEAAEMIAVLSDGGMRDALSIMDQCASYTSDHITIEDIDRIYGLTTAEEKIELIESIVKSDLADILSRVESYEQRGIDLQRFTDGMIEILKDVVIWINTKKKEILRVTDQDQAMRLAQSLTSKTCMHVIEKLLDTKERFKVASSAADIFEVACLSLATEDANDTVNTASAQVTVKPQPKAEPIKIKTEQPAEKPVEKEEVQMEKPKPEVKHEAVTIDRDMILKLLVQCSKAEKQKDEVAFAGLKFLMDLDSRKYTSLLNDTKIAASGADCILLVSDARVVANRINEPAMNRDMYYFFRDRLEIDKMIYAITSEDFIAASGEFRVLMKEDRLPEAVKVERYKKEEEKTETSEDRVKALFGEDNVEIIGG